MYNQMKRGFLKKGLDPESKPPTPKPGPKPIVNAGTQALSTLSVDDGIYGQMKRGFLKQGASGRPSAKGVPASSTGASPLSEEITDAKGGRFQIVCPADQCKSKAEQPGVITLRLSPCYCTYAAGGRESSLLMIGSRAELEEAIPFAEAALQQPLPPQGPHPFRIADAGKKGLGMFATRAIKAGELIIAERPLVISSPTSHGTKHEIAYTRPFYDAALTALSEPARTALLDLADTCSLGPPEHTHPLPGRLMTNAYSCGPLTATNAVPDDADIAKGEGVPWNATYATLPRANHACTPNAHYSWNRARWCGQFFAARDIAAGVEITSRYVLDLTQAERHAHLERTHSCACLCESCVDVSPAAVSRSDARRQGVDHYLRTLRAALNPKDYPYLGQEEIRRTLRQAREEGMMVQYAEILWEVSRIMQVQENPLVGLRWAKEARKAHVLILGEESWIVARVDDCGQFLAERLRAGGVACQWP